MFFYENKMLNNIESFSQKTINALNHYVYALVNPADETIFYIGEGKGNRGFDSIKKIPKGNNELKSKIKALRAEGIEPRLDILRYGMEKEIAQEVEAAIIDSFGKSNLSNVNRGMHTEKGRTRAYDLNLQLGGRQLNIEDIQDNKSGRSLGCRNQRNGRIPCCWGCRDDPGDRLGPTCRSCRSCTLLLSRAWRP